MTVAALAEPPEPDLTQTGGIDQAAAPIDRDHPGRDGGVLSPADPLAHLRGPKREPGLKRVEQTGFTNPVRPDEADHAAAPEGPVTSETC